MPFNLEGNWVPEPIKEIPLPPVKVIKEKRKNSFVTLILHLSPQKHDLKKLCSTLKQRFGCGGAIKDGTIELQGDQVEQTKQELLQLGIKLAKK